MSTDSIWSEVTLQEGMEHEQQIGTLYYRMEVEQEEVWIGYIHRENGKDQPTSSDEITEDEWEWHRWSFAKLPRKIHLKPYLPDKAMVVHSEYPQRLLPGDQARIFIGIPSMIRFESDHSKDLPLLELPSEQLSRTWFGDRLEGELCYWWSTRARRKMPEMNRESTRIGCPVKIINKSDEELYFEKFCHRVTRLQVYLYEEGLWTEETEIAYKGEEDLSDVTVQGRLPREFKGAKKISPAREEVRRNLALRTFMSFI